MSVPNDIVLYFYPFSPYARKITNYLALRDIDYAACSQPVILPREDLNLLGIQYRRIPLLAVGRDVYADTRLIIRKLEQRFPNPLGSTNPTNRGIERVIQRWISDSGVFMRAAGMIPPNNPTMKDPKFLKDRTGFSGREWTSETQARGRPESIAHIMDAFEILETTFLAESQWIGGGKEPSLADVEAQWIFEWLINMPGAVPKEFGEKYPKTFAWIKRLGAVVQKKNKKPTEINGAQAKDFILAAAANDHGSGVMESEPTGLKAGEKVEVFPTDSGFSHKDTGKLVTLNSQEIAIEVQSKTPGKTVILHVPRWGFRVQRASGNSKM